MLAEYLDGIAYLSVRTCDVDHGLVHADIADNGTTLPANKHLTPVVREATVEAVRIADRYHRYLPRFGERGMPPVAYGFARLYGLDTQDSGA